MVRPGYPCGARMLAVGLRLARGPLYSFKDLLTSRVAEPIDARHGLHAGLTSPVAGTAEATTKAVLNNVMFNTAFTLSGHSTLFEYGARKLGEADALAVD